MRKQNDNFFKDCSVTFLLSFTLVSLFFWGTRHFVGGKLPSAAIILSPHFDDATLSLGGFMAENNSPAVVATFFGGKPAETTEGSWDKLSGFRNSEEAVTARLQENARALAQTGAHPLNLHYVDFQYRGGRDAEAQKKLAELIEKDIGTIIESFSFVKEISVYGPAEFGPDITHPDHQTLHDTFVRIAREKSGDNSPRIRFFFYEDFPYVARYRKSTATPLKTFLEEKNAGLKLRETPLSVSASALSKKLESIKAYASQEKAFESLGDDISADAKTFTESRCRKTRPTFYGCEVVYEILPL